MIGLWIALTLTMIVYIGLLIATDKSSKWWIDDNEDKTQ